MSRVPTPGETILGKYRIERQIAEGGMGILLEATHLQLDERVAIKLLKPEVLADDGSSSIVSRFLQEARATIKIRSEHVVRVIDVGTLEDSGTPYIVMELLEGQDLDQVVTGGGPLPLRDAVDYLLQACEALAEAHARGVVHRDLKPANLFLAHRADGSACVKILDFGISKVQTKSDVGITNTSAVMGSPRYMSPEQMRATRNVDARADIWAIGIILYELVTGRAPFDGATLTEVCAAIVADTPLPLSSLRPGVPSAIDAVAAKCLAKDPSGRYANVAELAEALVPFGGDAAQAAATRIARVLRLERPAPSSQALPVASTSAKSAPTLEAASPAGMTSVAWGDERGGGKGPSRRLPFLGGALVGILLAIGVVIFAVHKSHDAPAAATAPGPRDPSPPPPPPTTPASAPATAASTAPDPVASALPSASVGAPADAASAALAATSKPHVVRSGGTAPKPTTTAKAATGKDLWGERK